MQSKIVDHKGLLYNYDYLEAKGAILIFKQNKLAYMIKVVKKGKKLNCNCPGSRYRGSCWHLSIAKQFDFSRVVRARGFIARLNEEFISHWLEMRNKFSYERR